MVFSSRLLSLLELEQFCPANKTYGSIQIKSDDQAGIVGMAKIPFTRFKTVLTAVQGKILRIELENENGYLVYGVESVKSDCQIVDVKVDAGDGKVLKIETDQKDSEGNEGEDSDNDHEEGGEK